jgi:hypothetical protein
MASVFQLLNDANIAVYPVDARGLFAGGLDASDPTPKRVSSRMIVGRLNSRMNFNTSVLQTMDSFAEMTGGRAFYNTNDLEHAFASASEDSSSYYLLGFYRRSGDDKPGWRRLTVKVPKHGLKVRARSGYFVNPRSSAPADHYQDLTIALSSPLDFIALPMALEWQPLTPGGDALKVPFILEIAFKLPELARGDPYHLNFVVAAVARNEKGEPGGHLAQTVDLHLAADASASNPDRVVRIQGKLELRARGEYTVRVAVRDNFSGQIGSLIAPVKVE